MSDEDQTTVRHMRIAAVALNIVGYLILVLTIVLSLHLAIGLLSCLFGIAAATLSFYVDIKRLKAPSVLLSIGIFVAALAIDYIDYLSRVHGR